MAGNYAVAGLVVLGWEDARAYVEAAEEAQLPVILQAGPGCRKHTPVPILGKMFRYLAEQASVPVVCHIDHARSVEECQEGIDHGFSSVMIDGSMLPLAENIALTQRVVDSAKPNGISVEGEVGVVGYSGGAVSAHTSPDEAQFSNAKLALMRLPSRSATFTCKLKSKPKLTWRHFAPSKRSQQFHWFCTAAAAFPQPCASLLASTSKVKKFNIGTELRMAFGKSLRARLAENPREFDRIKLLAATAPASRNAARQVIEELSGVPTPAARLHGPR